MAQYWLDIQKKDSQLRYHRPVTQLVHWNSYEARQFRPQDIRNYYLDRLKAFLMYRNTELVEEWGDDQEKCAFSIILLQIPHLFPYNVLKFLTNLQKYSGSKKTQNCCIELRDPAQLSRAALI